MLFLTNCHKPSQEDIKNTAITAEMFQSHIMDIDLGNKIRNASL